MKDRMWNQQWHGLTFNQMSAAEDGQSTLSEAGETTQGSRNRSKFFLIKDLGWSDPNGSIGVLPTHVFHGENTFPKRPVVQGLGDRLCFVRQDRHVSVNIRFT